MFETVTVKQAIQRGRKMVTFPMMIILWGSIGLSIYLAFGQQIFFALPIGIWVAVIAAMVYRSFMITKWRLWAFENVQNVNQLKREAAQAMLIPTENNFFEKIEIRTAAEKVKWSMLQERFNTPDKFEDDPDVPPKTIVYYSKIKKLLWVLVFSISFFAGLGMIYVGQYTSNYIFGAILILFGGTFIFIYTRDAFNQTPQIILDNEGLSTVNTPFYKWQAITDEKIIVRGSGKTRTVYLTYKCPMGSQELKIDDFTVWSGQLERLIRVYRARSDKR
jgi:hypothetical protein